MTLYVYKSLQAMDIAQRNCQQVNLLFRGSKRIFKVNQNTLKFNLILISIDEMISWSVHLAKSCVQLINFCPY